MAFKCLQRSSSPKWYCLPCLTDGVVVGGKWNMGVQDVIHLFLQKGEGREKEGNTDQLPLADWELNLSVHRLVLNALNHTSQG